MQNSDTLITPVLGDMILWHSNPFSANESGGVLGWICRKPGTQTITALIYAEDLGFVEKPSVRCLHDPYWQEDTNAANTAQWGAYTFHESTKQLRELGAMMTQMKIARVKKELVAKE